MRTAPTRRDFLKTATQLSALCVSVPIFIPRTVFAQNGRPGANDRLGLAGIGVGRQGSGRFNGAASDPRCQVLAVCDVYKKRALDHVHKYKLSDEAAVVDYRQIIDNKNVDAIVTATTEHWRSLICINAMLAGKHLYVEKPIALTIEDLVLYRKAQKKHNICFQSGSHQRSENPENTLVRKFIAEGHIGKVSEVIAGGYESPWIYGGFPEEKLPETLDWELWCGPGEIVPFHSQLFTPRGKPGWISFYQYSGGEVTGWGTHGFDQIQNALGKDEEGPVKVLIEGEKLIPPIWKEPQEKKIGDEICGKPKLTYVYADGVKVVLDDKLNKGGRGGGTFIGDKGTIAVDRGRLNGAGTEMGNFVRDWLAKNLPTVKKESHTKNWIDCIYSGKQPTTPLEWAIRTTEICFALNIARYVGKNLTFDPVKEEFIADGAAEANKYLSREHRKGFEQPAVS
ncbi:MAG: Gfo/Idh/MocA family oxidoreductase [Planctomycetaceae bacterium]|jgi:predicted dehydrogenase|nr:Gfo/Idh/MocA family oxidoreductase [Planctomycetaceae bacterium]